MIKIVGSIPPFKRSILYYPTITVPSNSWLRSSLLYWDEVCSIVPQDYDGNNLISLSKDIHYLMNEGLFRSIRPDQLIHADHYSEIRENFKNELIDIVNSSEFKKIKKASRQKVSKFIGLKVPKSTMIYLGSKIHYDKISHDIFDFLKENKLAEKESQFSSWLLFEQNTALLYMSLLAKYLAGIDKEDTIIGTDRNIYERLNFKQTNKSDGVQVMSCDFRRIIPSPGNNVSIEDIVKFKRKRKENLAAFQKVLRELQIKLSKAESNSDVKQTLISFQQDLKKGLQDLTAVYKDSKMELALKSLKSMINLKSSTLVAGVAVVINEKYKVAEMPGWLSGLSLAATAVIDVATMFIEARNKKRIELRKSSFSYLYHAQRAGIVPWVK
jgi:hypothetical protein